MSSPLCTVFTHVRKPFSSFACLVPRGVCCAVPSIQVAVPARPHIPETPLPLPSARPAQLTHTFASAPRIAISGTPLVNLISREVHDWKRQSLMMTETGMMLSTTGANLNQVPHKRARRGRAPHLWDTPVPLPSWGGINSNSNQLHWHRNEVGGHHGRFLTF